MVMITKDTSPGVYIEEKESGARPIEVAGTSTAAFLGRTQKGPANIPTPIESYAEYVTTFGGISDTGTSLGDEMALAVRAFFLNGGAYAYVTNVCNGSAKSTGTLVAGRGKNNEVTLYTVEAKGAGAAGDDISVVLTPVDGPGSGRFRLAVLVKGVQEEEFPGPIAPGLAESLENEVNRQSKHVALRPGTELARRVYTSLEIKRAALGNLGATPTFHVSGYWKTSCPLNLTFPVGIALADLAGVVQRSVVQGLRGSPHEGTPFECETVDQNTIRCTLKTTDPEAGFAFSVSPSPPPQTFSTNRSALLSDLVRGTSANADLPLAVLSDVIQSFKVSDLTGKSLAIRVGDEFGRQVVLPGCLGPDESLRSIASKLQSMLRHGARIATAALPTAIVENNECKIKFGNDAPADSCVVYSAGPISLEEKSGYWSLTANGSGTGKIKVRFPSQNPRSELSFEFDAMENTLVAWCAAINTARKESPPDAAECNVAVEAIGDQLLVWDEELDVRILQEGTELTWIENSAEPLSDIQETLPITARLFSGSDGTAGTRDDYEAAFELLEEKRDVSIICLPGSPWDKGGSGSGKCWEAVEAAISHATEQKDRMVIVDPPKPNGTSTDSQWRSPDDVTNARLPSSTYCAVYYPWVRVPVKNGTVVVAPSGFAAGIWSRTDKSRGVWKAPAGLDATIFGVDSLVHELTDTIGGILNGQGINCLRNISGAGTVVWGARTMATQTAPQWRYLPVRRTALMIEDSLREALRWAVHQPNNSILWSTLRINIEAFMNRLMRAGAFQSLVPSEAYFVRCGLGSTMTQGDIDAGIVRAEVGFAPVKPAEFVVISIEQISEVG